MVQWIRELAAKHDSLSSVPQTPTVDAENKNHTSVAMVGLQCLHTERDTHGGGTNKLVFKILKLMSVSQT